MYPMRPKSVSCDRARELQPVFATGLAGLGCVIEQILTELSFNALQALSSANFPTPTTISTPVSSTISTRDLSQTLSSCCLSDLGSLGGVMFLPLDVINARGQ